MKGVRQDILSVLVVLAVSLGLAAVFPREAIGFSASVGTSRASAPSAAIVFLDSASAARAMNAARTFSKNGDGAFGVSLLSSDLPKQDTLPVMSVFSRRRAQAPTVVEGGTPPFLPSRRAAPPVRIAGGKGGDVLPFSRENLLKLN